MKLINKFVAIISIALINVKTSFGAGKKDWVEASRRKKELKHETTVPASKQSASTSGLQTVEGRQMSSTVASPQQFEYKKHNARNNNGNGRRNGDKNNALCWNCGQSGHFKNACPGRTLCEMCKSSEHPTENCIEFELEDYPHSVIYQTFKSPPQIVHSPETLITEAGKFLQQGRMSLCTEKLWGAGTLALSILAQQNRIELRSPGAFYLFVQHLDENTEYLIGWTVLQRCHENFSTNRMNLFEVQLAFDTTVKFVDEIVKSIAKTKEHPINVEELVQLCEENQYIYERLIDGNGIAIVRKAL